VSCIHELNGVNGGYLKWRKPGLGGGVVSDICFEKVKSIERFKMRKMVRLFRISSLFLFGNLALYSLVIPFITTMN
jgi:hypothetical protein